MGNVTEITNSDRHPLERYESACNQRHSFGILSAIAANKCANIDGRKFRFLINKKKVNPHNY